MLITTQCKVLIPDRILKQQNLLSNDRFIELVLDYLIPRYPNYDFICMENDFAVCNRVDEVQERRKKRG